MEKISRREFIQMGLGWAITVGGVMGVMKFLNSWDFPEAGGASPRYLDLHRRGELARRGQYLWRVMERCQLCPRRCGVNRLKGEKGFCGASADLVVAAFHPHFGEERPLVGKNGSGTIFFSHCNLRCVFCINADISQGGEGQVVQVSDLVEMMLELERRGCHNINLVTPTHYVAHIILALDRAAARGLRLPVVYNTCGWERVEILRELAGIVDIYLPDFKYSSGLIAAKYSAGASSYPEGTQQALLEMQRQVGVIQQTPEGMAYRGLMIRHLVMPNNVSGSKEVVAWIAAHLPKNTYVNLMAQYQPVYKAAFYPEIARRITAAEYAQAVQAAKAAGLTHLDVQGFHF